MSNPKYKVGDWLIGTIISDWTYNIVDISLKEGIYIVKSYINGEYQRDAEISFEVLERSKTELMSKLHKVLL